MGKTNPLKNVYFGEQHLHTSASPDAFAVGTRGRLERANTTGAMTQGGASRKCRSLHSP